MFSNQKWGGGWIKKMFCLSIGVDFESWSTALRGPWISVAKQSDYSCLGWLCVQSCV